MHKHREQPRVANHLTVVALVFAVLTVILAGLLMAILPAKAELPQGYFTPILAFEFARTPADLAWLAGQNEAGQAVRDQLDLGHKVDMLFPFAYGGFLALLLLRLGRAGEKVAWLALPIALAIIPFDIHENLNLLAITDALNRNADTTSLLAGLYWATWLKWAAIGLSIAAITVCWIKRGRTFPAAAGGFASLAVLVCAALGTPAPLAELMSLLIVVFLIAALFTVIKDWRKNRLA